jgi:hypothetical protein
MTDTPKPNNDNTDNTDLVWVDTEQQVGINGGHSLTRERSAMRITVVEHAGEHTVFDRNAFTRSLGKQLLITIEGQQAATATLVQVIYSPDRRSATLTLEIPDSEDQNNGH